MELRNSRIVVAEPVPTGRRPRGPKPKKLQWQYGEACSSRSSHRSRRARHERTGSPGTWEICFLLDEQPRRLSGDPSLHTKSFMACSSCGERTPWSAGIASRAKRGGEKESQKSEAATGAMKSGNELARTRRSRGQLGATSLRGERWNGPRAGKTSQRDYRR